MITRILPEIRIALKRSTAACVFALLVFGGTALAVRPTTGNDQLLSNLDLMTNLGTKVVENMLSGIDPQLIEGGIRLKPFAAAESYRLLNNVFVSVFKSKGIKIYAPASAPGQPVMAEEDEVPLLLEYETLDFSLAYDKIYRSYLIGGKRVKRRAELKILARLVTEPDSEILWVGEKSAGHADQFSLGDVGKVEAGTYQFTKPARPSTGWGKLVEPVFVSGIIVGMIYLFFSNQSDS